jgi:hypothetical protein
VKVEKTKRAAQLIFSILVMALVLVPLVGMAWAPTSSTTENRELAMMPSLVNEDGEPNISYLSELGAWFEDHFAYRNQFVAVNALIRAEVFGVSASDQVIVGSNGWLYYGGTVNDYVGASPLTDRELRSIAHNLYLTQTYAEAMDARFAFTIAPNKNTLYPEHMPSFYCVTPEASNAERLVAYLEEYGVNYVDLFLALDDDDGGGGGGAQSPLYLLRDSHWNNRGAFIADTALAEELGVAPLTRSAEGWVERVDSQGDLDSMLFPHLSTPELQFYLPGINDGEGFSGSSWSYSGTAHDVEADLSQTSGKGDGTLIAYRDSFGNALLPYLAAQTGSAEFSKLVPYNGLRIAELEADYVLVERAERHIDYLARNAPILPCPTVRIDTSGVQMNTPAQTRSSCEEGANGPLVSFSGVVDPRLVEDDSLIYVSVRPVSHANDSDENASAAGDAPVAPVAGDEDAAGDADSTSFADDAPATSASGDAPATPVSGDEAAVPAAGDEAAAAPVELVFEAFLLSTGEPDGDNGYLVYVPKSALPEGESEVRVFIAQSDGLFLVQSIRYRAS